MFLSVLSGGFESRPLIRGLQGRSVSMRAPSKTKDTLSKVFPLSWSFGSKDRRKPDPVPPSVQDSAPAELVQYLESGRRPRCTKDPIVTVMSESRRIKDTAEGRASANVRSASAGSLSCISRAVDELPPDSTLVREGQRRASDKTASLRRRKGIQARDEMSSSSGSNTLTSKKDARRQSSSKASQETTETKISSSVGVQPSNSSPSLQDGTLRRPKGERDDQEHRGANEGNSKTKKGEVPKNHEGLRSFLKGNFLKKEKDSRKSREGESGRGGGEEGDRRTRARLPLSNGAAGEGTRVERGKSSGPGHLRDELANRPTGRSSANIKRSQSSSNIPTKAEQSMRRTASLHRNGMTAAPPAPAPPRSLTTDKPSSGTLQRARYSTTSLGRKRTVPESSF